MLTAAIQKELDRLADPGHAMILKRFFKTGPGEYGEGDRFRGLRVPVLRQMAKKYWDVPLAEAERLLQSAFHEDRLLALFILIHRYYQGDLALQGEIHRLYLKRRRFVNNWESGFDAIAPTRPAQAAPVAESSSMPSAGAHMRSECGHRRANLALPGSPARPLGP